MRSFRSLSMVMGQFSFGALLLVHSATAFADGPENCTSILNGASCDRLSKDLPEYKMCCTLVSALDTKLSGCEYMTLAAPENKPAIVVRSAAPVGCVQQCVARVFCLSEASEKFGANYAFSSLDKLFNSKEVACDANPDGTCPPSEDCMAAAKRSPSRIAVAVKPAPSKTVSSAHYGLNFEQPEDSVSQFNFPPKGTSDKSSCRICLNTVSLAGGKFGAVACKGSKDSCPNADDCAADELTPKSLSSSSVKRFTASGATGQSDTNAGTAK